MFTLANCLKHISLVLLLTPFSHELARAENAPNRLKDWQLEITEDFEKIYAPLMRASGRKLELNWRWDSDLNVASADSDGKTLKIIVHKGMLSSPRLSADSFRFVLCHEIGHLLGGAPRRSPPMEWNGSTAPDGQLWVSSEGQADYYASLSCFRRMIQGQNHRQALDNASTGHLAPTQPCNRIWGQDTEGSLICQRTSLGGWGMLQLVKDFAISFQTPDTSITPKIIRDAYPPRQCRLDTILAGALCKSEPLLELDFNHHGANDCADPAARRPTCWYPQ